MKDSSFTEIYVNQIACDPIGFTELCIDQILCTQLDSTTTCTSFDETTHSNNSPLVNGPARLEEIVSFCHQMELNKRKNLDKLGFFIYSKLCCLFLIFGYLPILTTVIIQRVALALRIILKKSFMGMAYASHFCAFSMRHL